MIVWRSGGRGPSRSRYPSAALFEKPMTEVDTRRQRHAFELSRIDQAPSGTTKGRRSSSAHRTAQTSEATVKPHDHPSRLYQYEHYDPQTL